MLYEDDEVLQIKEDLTNILHNVPEFLDGTLDDVKTTLREYASNIPHTPYESKKLKNSNEKEMLEHKIEHIETQILPSIEAKMADIETKKTEIYNAIHGPQRTTDPQLLRSYVAELDAYVKDLQNHRVERDSHLGKIENYKREIKALDSETSTLGKDLKSIVDTFSDENLKSVIELSDIYSEINNIAPIQLGNAATVNKWIENCAEELSESEIQEKLKIGKYSGILANEHLRQANAEITTYLTNVIQNPQGPINRNTFFGLDAKTRKEIYDVLTAVKTGADTHAKAEIEGRLTELKTKRTAVDTAYNDARKTIDDVLGTLPAAVGNVESVAEELVEYSGNGTFDEIKASDIYATRLNELVVSNVANIDYGGNSFQQTYQNIINAVGAGMPKGEANKLLARLNDTIKFTRGRVTRELNDKIKEVGGTYETYKKDSESLDAIFNANPLNLIDDFLHIASEYGYAKLNGANEDSLKRIRDEASYIKIENALARKEASEDSNQNKMDYRNTHNMFISDVYRAIINDAAIGVQNGGISKSEAVKFMKEISGRVNTIKRRVALDLDENLTNIYRNVIAGSRLDTTSLRDRRKYMILSNSNKLLSAFDNENGTHAEAGLGWYFEQFVERIDVVEEPGLGKKIWGYITRNPAAPRTVRKPRNNVKDIMYKVVEKHKNAAYNDINDENRISIDEAMMVALGLAAETKKMNAIAASWNSVTGLTYAADIDTITNTYLDAADIGAEINSAAKIRTRLKGNAFRWLDNHFNEKAGLTYKYKDRGIDFLNGIFEQAGIGGSKLSKEELTETDWTKEITAIKPNKYPKETMLAIAAGLGIGIYALTRNKVIDKKHPISTENSDVLSFWELLKEVLLIRVLAGKHK